MARNDSSRQVIKEKYFLSKYPLLSANKSYWWWDNPTNANSLRLSIQAFYMLKRDNHEKFYKFDLPHEILPKTFIQLERHFEEPYFIGNSNTIYIMGEQEAMMLALHANNLQQYLDNHSR